MRNDVNKTMRKASCASAVIAVLLLGACASAPPDSGEAPSADASTAQTQGAGDPIAINDPYERQNRASHRFNLGLDRSLVRPVSGAYGAALPRSVRRGVANFAQNLGMPRRILNNALQGDIEGGTHNTIRFVVNTTAGIGGLFDPATTLDIPYRDTGFGETLHRWGSTEGAYLELPVFGPSTMRDAVGLAGDFLLNPLSLAEARPNSYVRGTAAVGARLGDRYDARDIIDPILYDSADSYAQLRLVYLQRRRFELSNDGSENTEAYEDPYEIYEE
ncbi:MAG: VacJ family lipoprotein [Rhodobacteraceae bacterium]|nr:VacJ family lipoprotein [Paracoccaceae bacterium]